MATSADRTTPADEDTSPIQRAQHAARKVMHLFPVRVWQRFSERNGMVLAAGASYQALFAMFAAVYVVFAGVGLWLGGAASEAVEGLIRLINSYLPGVIADKGGLISKQQLLEVADQSATTLGVTGIVALLVVAWTAIGWIGSVRNTVRDIFGLQKDRTNPVWLVVRDLIAAVSFAVLMLIGALLGWASTGAMHFVFSLVGIPTDSGGYEALGRIIAVLVMFLVDAITLMVLFRFLTGTTLRTRDVLPGALLGAAGVTALQMAFGFLVSKTPSNPLLVGFAVLIGLLLWIRLVMMVILLAAAWVAEAAEQNDVPIVEQSDDERELREATLLRDAAELRLAEAQDAIASSTWLTSFRARRDLAKAQAEFDSRTQTLEHLRTVRQP